MPQHKLLRNEESDWGTPSSTPVIAITKDSESFLTLRKAKGMSSMKYLSSLNGYSESTSLVQLFKTTIVCFWRLVELCELSSKVDETTDLDFEIIFILAKYFLRYYWKAYSEKI